VPQHNGDADRGDRVWHPDGSRRVTTDGYASALRLALLAVESSSLSEILDVALDKAKRVRGGASVAVFEYVSERTLRLLAGDPEEWPESIDGLSDDPAVWAAPIRAPDGTWGVIFTRVAAGGRLRPVESAQLSLLAEVLGGVVPAIRRREDARSLADEHAALGRVATFVAKGVPASELLHEVATEVAGVLQVEAVTIAVHEREDTQATVVASVGVPGFPVGSCWAGSNFEGTLGWMVVSTGRPARIDNYGRWDHPAASATRASHVGSTVAVPRVCTGSPRWSRAAPRPSRSSTPCARVRGA
jgi:hypothetical protein